MHYKLIIFFLLILRTAHAHPVHVSVTNIVFDSVQHEAEVTIKTYVDDLDLLFIHHEQYDVKFADHEMNKTDSLALMEYLAGAIQLSNNFPIPSPVNNLSVKFEELSISITFTMPCDFTKTDVLVTHTWLMDLYHDQSNMVFIGSENNEQAYLFNRQNRQQLHKLY